MHAGVDGITLQFSNSVIWYSKEQMDQYELVIKAAENSRNDGSDLYLAYGDAVNPNGTFASSTDLGIIPGPLFPTLPGKQICNSHYRTGCQDQVFVLELLDLMGISVSALGALPILSSVQ